MQVIEGEGDLQRVKNSEVEPENIAPKTVYIGRGGGERNNEGNRGRGNMSRGRERGRWRERGMKWGGGRGARGPWSWGEDGDKD